MRMKRKAGEEQRRIMKRIIFQKKLALTSYRIMLSS